MLRCWKEGKFAVTQGSLVAATDQRPFGHVVEEEKNGNSITPSLVDAIKKSCGTRLLVLTTTLGRDHSMPINNHSVSEAPNVWA
jgi:hypothetical protein